MIEELSTLEIARLEEARQSLAIATMMRLGAEHFDAERFAVLELGGGTACYAGPGSWANQAQGLGLSGPVGADELDELVEFFVSRGVEPRIEVCAFADADYLRGLADRSFVLRGFENVFARTVDPEEPLEALRRELPGDLRLERVDLGDERAVDELGEVATSGFRAEGEPLSGPWLEGNRLNALLPGAAAWVIRHGDGGAVAGASMEARPGAGASLFGTSVLPPFRRLGLQARLIVERLIHARDTGSKVVTIHSSPHVATQRNAVRLGFGLAYAKVILVRPGPGLAVTP